MTDLIDVKIERSKRLKLVRGMTGLTAVEFASPGLFQSSSVTSWEQGRFGGLTLKGAQKVILRLSELGVVCQLNWLMDGEGIEPYFRKENTLEPLASEMKGNAIQSELALFRSQNDTLDMVMSDESMSPIYQAGDIVAGIKVGDFEEAIGKPCIVRLSSGEYRVRFLQKGTRPKRYTLLAYNQDADVEVIEYDQALVCVAPVLWMRRSI